MIHTFDPQDGASGLVPHHNHLTLRGTPPDVKFPSLCPNCGGHASRTIFCSKVFSRTEPDEPAEYVVTTAAVPFCDACIASHHAQRATPSSIDVVVASFASMHVVGAVFPALAALFLARIALGDLAHGRALRCLVELGFCAVAAAIAWAQAWSVWQSRARFRVPPQTEVTKAFDFSDDLAPAFEASRFDCTMRDDRFAAAFRALNIDDEYLPQGARAASERRRSNVLLWGFGAIALVAAAWGFLEDLFG